MEQKAPKDVPFYPDYLHRRLGGPVKWVLAQRLTDRLRQDGHEVAIHPKRYQQWQREHAEEVRAAVIGRLQDCIAEGIEVAASPADIVARLLEDPGVKIMTDHGERALHSAGL